MNSRKPKGRKAPPPFTVGIGEILRDPQFQIRSTPVTPKSDAVKRYIGAYLAEEPMPAVKIMRHNGAYVLIDGWHRMAALEALGRTEVEAEEVQGASLEQVRWLAGKANLTHGEPMQPKEYRGVFRAYIEAGQHQHPSGGLKSYREISKDLSGARNHVTIRTWMQKDFPKIAEQMSGEEPAPKGPRELPQREFLIFVRGRQALDTVAAAARALSDEGRRGDLVVALEAVLESLRAKPHKLPEPPRYDLTEF